LVDVESASTPAPASAPALARSPDHDHHRAAAGSAAEPGEADIPHATHVAQPAHNLNLGGCAGQVGGPATPALHVQLFREVVDAILHLAGIERILLRPARGAGEGHRFVAAVGLQPRVG